MRTVKRPRRYVARHWVVLGRPLLRYSEPRDAYVLRIVGRKWGPVLKLDRRHGGAIQGAAERRGSHTRTA
ncbi:MAG TPA: hypothetical protein VF927_00030 [Solirubrobacteraceae bacterium]